MKIYIKNFDYSNEEELVEVCEQTCRGYHKDTEGKEYFYVADGRVLKQIYCHDEHGDETIEWSIGSSHIHGLSGNLEVEFFC